MLSFCESHSRRDVLVTGVGLVTPLGCSAAETWERLIRGERAGRSLSASEIDHYDQLREISGLRLNGAPVDHAEVARRLNRSSFRSLVSPAIAEAYASEPLVAMSLVALAEALSQANLQPQLESPHRAAVVFGSSKGGLRSAEQLTRSLADSSSRPVPVGSHVDTEFGMRWTHAFQTDSATRAIAAVTGVQAGIVCPVAACATGLIAILQGAAMIHSGLCDLCIVGSADAGLRGSVLSSFHRLRVTSRHHDAATACRPFDQSRDGFLIGEGAAVLVLESREHAAARGQQGLARVLAGGWLNDPTGMTQIDTSGTVVAEVLRRTCSAERFRPDVIGLHGTGTESNDLAEARGVQQIYGDSPLPCYGVKGAIGHLLGAAGSVESGIAVLSLGHRRIPGTTNLINQDANCPIPLSSNTVEMPTINRTAKLSLGFGGHVACGIFQQAEGT